MGKATAWWHIDGLEAVCFVYLGWWQASIIRTPNENLGLQELNVPHSVMWFKRSARSSARIFCEPIDDQWTNEAIVLFQKAFN